MNGQFVWYELMTNDVDAAIAFYTKVIGWKITPFGEGESTYPMWTTATGPVGGAWPLSPEAKQMGAKPAWIAHISTADVDVTTKRAVELGGQVLVPPMDIPNVGRFSLLTDRQGAAFNVFTSSSPMPETAPEPCAGMFCWHELNTTDYEDAWKFYSELFGWKETSSMDMGQGMGLYWMFRPEGAKNATGGMSNMAKVQKVPAHWLYYIVVNDLREALERVAGNGGQVATGPMEIPGGDHIAVCIDPQGAFFAMFQTKPPEKQG